MNGNIGVAKAYLSDICDDSNQARAFSFLGVTGGIGKLVSPALGGLLAKPAVSWPTVFSPSGLFGTYPYLLPCLVGAGVSLISLICSILWLEESIPKRTVDEPATRVLLAEVKSSDSIRLEDVSLDGVEEAANEDAIPQPYQSNTRRKMLW